MYTLPGNAYIFAIFILFQGFLVLLVLFLFIDKFFSTRKHRLEADLVKQDAFKQALKELGAAKTKAQQIIKDAQISAADIISKSEYISASTQKNLDDGINNLVKRQELEIIKIIDSFNAELKSEFDKERITTLSGFKTIFQEVKDASIKQLSSFNDILTNSSLDAEGSLKAQASEHLEEMRLRLKVYEEAKTKEIQDKLFSVLLAVNKNFFSQTMTIDDHEDLVIKLFRDAALKETLGL